MRPLETITLRLEQRGVGVRGKNIVWGTGADLPTTEPWIVSVTETGGRGPMDTHNSGSIKQPTFQVVARAADARVAAAKIDAAYAALGGGDKANQIANLVIGDVFWLWIKPRSEPFTLTPDTNNRNRIAFNIEGLRR